MPAPISLVVPTRNAADALPHLLGSAAEGLSAGLVRELVVSDGGSSDHTRTVAEAAGATWITGPASRGGQLQRGCAAARGAWLLVLHADTILPPGWSESVAARLDDPRCAWAFRLAFRADGFGPRAVATWANARSRTFDLPYGDQGLLIHRSLYDEIDGYPDIPLMEDVAIARALRGRLGLLPVTVSTGADRYLRDGWLRRGARNLWTLGRYLTGTPPETLVAGYERRSSEN